jgi:hypothetical protein
MSIYFPRSVPPLADSQAIIQHWEAMPNDWKAVTDTYEYADAGEDFNEVSSVAPVDGS